jgi:RHS repeat-associated protein
VPSTYDRWLRGASAPIGAGPSRERETGARAPLAGSTTATLGPGARKQYDEPAGSSPPAIPTATLPSGGGAIRGLDEKLEISGPTGTASLRVPIFTSAARQGFGPQLALGYDSGGGNGSCGLGWSIEPPSITRKTSKGLPRYDDGAESDVFLLAGSDDLVPLLIQGPKGWRRDHEAATVGGITFSIDRYRPRVESGFARIERWQQVGSGDTHWRTISPDNVTSLYGRDAASRITDPNDPSRVFAWLLDLSYDDRGNAIRYVYKPEDGASVPVSASEVGRDRRANRYLKRVLYGNRTPYLPHEDTALPAKWCFEIVLDYGEHEQAAPTPDEATPWSCRPDPFSSYRSTFEVRTYRRCRRVLMFHRFPDLGTKPVLVRSTELEYAPPSADTNLPAYSLLSSVSQTGWVATGSGYQTATLPPLDLAYAPLTLNGTIRTASADSLANVVVGGRHRFVDLDGEGLQGILSEDDSAWYYKRNVSAWNPGGGTPTAAFEPIAEVASRPALADADTLQLIDLNGNGHLCAVKLSSPAAGWFERDNAAGWSPFRPLEAAALVDWSSRDVRLVDLDGDGLADILVTEDDAISWHEWVGDGFAARDRAPKPFDEERGPALVIADSTETIFLADLSGDGLADLVRVRSGGQICYWPNHGFGRFGAKVTMDDAPVFDFEDRFDARRIQFADIDGSGTADLVYAGDTVTVWFNKSGNGWTSGTQFSECPGDDQVSRVSAFDLLGTGTACLVWTSPLPSASAQPLRYIDLTGGMKPFLLTRVGNNRGAETRIAYAPSTRFFLADRAAGRPWLTRLPFPVHVVERVETTEAISRTRLVTLHSYHHGFYDGVEREFRGFARVEQIDTETLPMESGIGAFTSTPPVDLGEFDLPPVRTISWFHTGAFFDRDDLIERLAAEWYDLDPQGVRLATTILPTKTDAEELRESCRALRGRPLRVEVYALDGTTEWMHPYVTTDHRYQVDRLQPRSATSVAAFHTWEREQLECAYERKPPDPRLSHAMTLAIDPFGTVTRAAHAAYPRRSPAFLEQGSTLVSYVESDVANLTGDPDAYRIGLPIETRSYELTGIHVDPTTGRFDPDALLASASTAADIPFEQAPVPAGAAQRRLTGRSRSIYLADDLSRPLAPGVVNSLGLVDESYQLVFTPGLLAAVLGAKLAGAALGLVLSAEGGYVELDGDGYWWAPSGKAFYSPNPAAPDPVYARAHYFLAQGSVDPWGNVSTVSHDPYDLLVTNASDPAGNATVTTHNYRVLAPWVVTDPNRNRNGVRYDALGMVAATATMGKLLPDGSDEGDHLDLASTELAAGDDPTTRFDYNLDAYRHWAADPGRDIDHPQPVWSRLTTREQHKLPGTRWIESYVYSDGLGRAALTKHQAEPGPAPKRDAAGKLVHDASGALVFAASQSRWVGSGRVVYDNKSNPVKAYESFFDSSPAFDDESDLVDWGVTSITRYDPLSRVVRIDKPDGTYSTVEFDAWGESHSDANDNVSASGWYAARASGALGPTQADAAQKALAHAGTPAVAHLDPLGRTFREVEDNGPGESYPTSRLLDIDGRTLSTTDALGRVALRHDYDLTGTALHSAGIDDGERWLLPDVEGNTIRAWDGETTTRTKYDELRRPTSLLVKTGGASERLAERLDYGESAPNPENANLRGAVHEKRDEAGIATTIKRDFDGNILRATRTLVADHHPNVDWANPPALSAQTFDLRTSFDAMKRPVTTTTPDGSITHISYNQRGLLTAVTVALRDGEPATYVSQVTYDAKGQRSRIDYGNGASTVYDYDPETFRLIRLRTTRPGSSAALQDISYAYDPVGNVTQISDGALQTIFYANQVVSPSSNFTYDPTYRLSVARGREHIGQTTTPQVGWSDEARVGTPLPSDGQAMRTYSERYSYDSVGNFTQIAHTAAGGNWTRNYRYDEPNIPPGNNRLTSATVGASTENFAYDAHGNITSMPHLTSLEWDWRDQLALTARQVVNTGTPETTYHRYDASGQRLRKTTDGQGGKKIAERISFATYEVYREYDASGAVVLERQSLHVEDGVRRICLIETPTIDNRAGSGEAPLVRYQLANNLGSAVLELDAAAAVITYEEYYPFGSTAFQAGRTAAEVSLKRYRYAGKERDVESGFSYYGARYYVPWLGRWTQPDPAGMVDGASLYVFVRNNPLALSDRDGLEGKLPRQQWFFEAKPFWQDVTATKKTRGGYKGIEANLQKFADWWGYGEPVDVGHMEKPFALTPAGETTKVAAEPSFANRSKGATSEKAEVAAKKAAAPKGTKKFVTREGKDDPTATAGKRGEQPRPAEPYTTEAFKKHKVTAQPAHAAPPSTPKGSAPVPHEKQLSFDFAKSEAHTGGTVATKEAATVAREGTTALKETAKVGGEQLLKTEAKIGLKGGAKLVGSKVAKFVPFVGIGVGAALVAKDYKDGDYKSLAWDAAEAVPIAGDVVGALHLGITTGTFLNSSLGIDKVAAEHGSAVEHAATSIGLPTDIARVAGATGAAVSAITVAPSMALGRTIAGWFK